MKDGITITQLLIEGEEVREKRTAAEAMQGTQNICDRMHALLMRAKIRQLDPPHAARVSLPHRIRSFVARVMLHACVNACKSPPLRRTISLPKLAPCHPYSSIRILTSTAVGSRHSMANRSGTQALFLHFRAYMYMSYFFGQKKRACSSRLHLCLEMYK